MVRVARLNEGVGHGQDSTVGLTWPALDMASPFGPQYFTRSTNLPDCGSFGPIQSRMTLITMTTLTLTLTLTVTLTLTLSLFARANHIATWA